MANVPFPLVALLEAAWAAGVNTWETKDHVVFTSQRSWHITLVHVTNARSRGWKIPSPWD